MSNATTAWHMAGLFDINKTLDVSPVGWQERDRESLPEEQKSEKRREIMRLGSRYDTLDRITIDNIGGPTWSFRKLQPRLGSPKAAMSLGMKPAVTAECREVMEKADLGETDFFRIEVLDIRRETVVWPELYVFHVRNSKESIDIEKEYAAGHLRQGSGKERNYSIYRGKTVTLSRVALQGPDIWRETQLANFHKTNVFMSDRLRKLLDDAGMAKAWGLVEVPVV